jgi:hypothetical protein
MLENDRERCRTVGVAARERVMNEYTWRHNARWVVGIAEDVIATRKRIGRKQRVASSLDPANPALAGGRADDGAARLGVLDGAPHAILDQSEDNSGRQR